MAVYDTFAKRKRAAENADKPYTYDTLPPSLRVQMVHILMDAIGDPGIGTLAPFLPVERAKLSCWQGAYAKITREMGVFQLAPPLDPSSQGYARPCLEFICTCDLVDWVLSLIEFLFREIEAQKEGTDYWFDGALPPHEAISDLNHRFREHSVGYQYAGGQIVQANSPYLHSEVVEPAISLLRSAEFKGALDEFMAAHAHYRERRHKEAIAMAGNAFESTLKTICDLRAWEYDAKKATSSTLIGIVFSKNLIPPELKNHFDGLRTAMESGLPTMRNRVAHGQGSAPIEVPGYLAAHCLHLAAANIVFLIEAHNANG